MRSPSILEIEICGLQEVVEGNSVDTRGGDSKQVWMQYKAKIWEPAVAADERGVQMGKPVEGEKPHICKALGLLLPKSEHQHGAVDKMEPLEEADAEDGLIKDGLVEALFRVHRLEPPVDKAAPPLLGLKHVKTVCREKAGRVIKNLQGVEE
jgi:hypothetical protein